MILAKTLRRWLPQKTERAVYEAIVAAARHPSLYAKLGVPDTLDGRFEMISLHAILVLRALAGKPGEEVERFRQALVDELFRDMDRSLREMGTGDLSVGKKVRKMAEVFYGRLRAYSAALDAGGGELEAALTRNLWPGQTAPHGAAGLAAYVKNTDRHVSAQEAKEIIAGRVDFREAG
jgi:cytochrome b pre-mRNA-processing protein 3